MNTLNSRLAYLDSLIYNIFPRENCFRVSAEADVEGNSVKAISAYYKIFRIPRIRGVVITAVAGKKHVINIQR